MKFEKHISNFFEYLLMKGYSERTKETYSQEIKKLVAFLDEHYPRINNIAQINKEILFDYSNYLSGIYCLWLVEYLCHKLSRRAGAEPVWYAEPVTDPAASACLPGAR